MGLTQNLGRLSPSIFSDASLNIGVGAAPSGSYKFEVTGTSKVSGVLTLGATISNGTYTYTLPAATGTLALVGGAGVGTVTSVAALTLGTTGTDLSSTVATSTTTPVITLNVPTASAANRGALSSADWSTFNSKQGTITLTTTGTSGAATFSSNTLNIPDYGSALSGYLPLTGGTLTGDLSIAYTTANLRLFLNNTTATTGRSWYFNSYSNGNLYVGNTTAGDIFNFSSTGAASFSSDVAISGQNYITGYKNTTIDRYDGLSMTGNISEVISNTNINITGSASIINYGNFTKVNVSNDSTGGAFGVTCFAGGFFPQITASAINAPIAMNGVQIFSVRSFASDISTNVTNSNFGIDILVGIRGNTLAGTYTNALRGITMDLFMGNTSTTNIAYGSFIRNRLQAGSTCNTFYGYALLESVGAFPTNYWGIYIDSTTAKNYIGGTTLIGTTTDSGYKLDVNGTGRFSGILTANEIVLTGAASISNTTNGQYLALYGNTGGMYFGAYNGGFQNYMRISASGSVGIGITSPIEKLHIYGTGANTQTLLLESSISAANAYLVQKSTSKSYITGLSTDFSNSYIIYDATAAAARLVVTTGGNVGIGSASPAQKLTIIPSTNLSSATTGTLSIGEASDNTGYRMHLGYLDIGGWRGFIQTYAASVAAPLLLNPSGGNVLIGTTTDDTVNKLQVTGSAIFSAAVTAYEVRTSNGVTSVPFNVATTIITLPGGVYGVFQVYAFSANNTGSYTAFATILQNGADATIANSYSGGALTLSLTGLNIKATQVSGVTLPITWIYLKIA